MKTFILAIATAFIFPATTEAGAIKEVYTNAQDEIARYYSTTGEWDLLSISKIDFAYEESIEFVTVSAKTTIRSISTGRVAKETCLVTFIEDNLEFYAINCF